MSLRLTFYGAAGTVTGSKYLVEDEHHRILVDAGLFQGRKELRLRNWDPPPYDPGSLSAIVLTHAHVDHTAYLPLLVRRGYRGPVYCTDATRDLLELLLLDTAHLQEEEARYANLHGTSKHHPAKPLYDEHDAREALRLLRTFRRDASFDLFPGVRLSSRCAGHILGAVSLNLDIQGKRITFSGDIGRYDAPMLPDPAPTEIGDLLLCEATYGDRLHSPGDVKQELAKVVRAAADRRGPLIIPAFAVGRTQTVLFYLAQLEREGKIPVLPVFVDSPMAVDATGLYEKYQFDHDEEVVELLRKREKPFTTERLAFCRTVEESKTLNDLSGPRIIISASGMVNGGRILHHMKNWLSREETTVLFVGYQGEETRGAKIQARSSEVKIFGQIVPIRAQIETITGLSAHGDRDELLRWLRSCSGAPKEVRIVHGEEPALSSFAGAVEREFGWKTRVARYLETITI